MTAPTSPLPAQSTGVFASLSVHNYRLYFGGQAVSLVGTWMQATAQAWLVLTLSGSSSILGLIVALQALPILIIGPYAGVVADRVDRRLLMIFLQSIMGVLALVLAILTLGGWIAVWQIAILALLLGLNNAFENPARQAFIHQIVGETLIRNAVTLNSVMVNAARAIGPAVAGVILAAVGAGWCFVINATSFVAVVVSLLAMRTTEISHEIPVPRAKGQLREGLRYVRSKPILWVPLVMMALVGTLAYEFQVSLPVAARDIFDGGPQAFGFMTSSMGVGAVVGGLIVAARGTNGPAHADRDRNRVRNHDRGDCGSTQPVAGDRRAVLRRLAQRVVHVDRQCDAPAQLTPPDAGSGDGAVVCRFHGFDADRRTVDRRDHAGGRGTHGTRGRRGVVLRGSGDRSRGVAAHPLTSNYPIRRKPDVD